MDTRQTAYWFRKAAGQGLAKAQYALGTLYVQGRGVSKDMVEGYKWIRVSGPATDDHVRAVLKTLSRSMTPEEIERAEQAARNWTDEHPGRRKNHGR
jgi:hypothetical protein